MGFDSTVLGAVIKEIGKYSGSAAHAAEVMCKEIWGNSEHIRAVSAEWQTAQAKLTSEVLNVLDNDMKALTAEQWSGRAKDAYSTWVDTMKSQALTPLNESFKSIQSNLDDAASVINDARSQLVQAGLSLLGALGGAVISGPAGWTAVAVAIGNFLRTGYNLYDDLGNKLDGIAAKMAQAVQPIGVSAPVPVLPPPIAAKVPFNIYGSETQPAPDPSGVIGDWGNWGKANPPQGS